MHGLDVVVKMARTGRRPSTGRRLRCSLQFDVACSEEGVVD